MRIWNSLLPCRHIALNLIFFMISGFFLKYFLQWTLLAYFWTVNFYSLTLTVHPVLLVYFIGPNAAISNLLCEVSTWENYSFWCLGSVISLSCHWHQCTLCAPCFTTAFIFQHLTLLTTCTFWNTCLLASLIPYSVGFPISLITYLHFVYSIFFAFLTL